MKQKRGLTQFHSEEELEKMRRKRNPFSEEHKKHLSKSHIGYKNESKNCIYCNKNISINNFSRWHGDNCKQKLIAYGN